MYEEDVERRIRAQREGQCDNALLNCAVELLNQYHRSGIKSGSEIIRLIQYVLMDFAYDVAIIDRETRKVMNLVDCSATYREAMQSVEGMKPLLGESYTAVVFPNEWFEIGDTMTFEQPLVMPPQL